METAGDRLLAGVDEIGDVQHFHQIATLPVLEKHDPPRLF
jgi:hypothetical protein